jgi:hypothetical protein
VHLKPSSSGSTVSAQFPVGTEEQAELPVAVGPQYGESLGHSVGKFTPFAQMDSAEQLAQENICVQT